MDPTDYKLCLKAAEATALGAKAAQEKIRGGVETWERSQHPGGPGERPGKPHLPSGLMAARRCLSSRQTTTVQIY